MSEGLLASFSKGCEDNMIFLFLILILLCSCGDGKSGFFGGFFDNNLLFLFLILFLFGGIF